MNNEVEIVVKATDRGARTTLAAVGREASKLGDDMEKATKRSKDSFSNFGRDIKKDMGKFGSDAAGSFGKMFESGISGAFDNISGLATKSPVGLAVGAAIAVPVASAVGAAVAAGITLGIGGGALAGGIVLAAKDPRVSDAWGSVFDSAKRKLTAESSVMVQPLIEASRSVGSAFDEIVPKIGSAFDKLAPRIAELGQGAGDMFKNIFKGDNFDRVIGVAGRMIGKLASELPNFGNAINNFLGSLADAGPGAERFWSEFLTGSQKTIVGIGNVIEVLSKIYVPLDDFGNHINDAFDKASKATDNFLTTTTEKANKFSFAHLFGWDDDEPTKKLTMLKGATDEIAQSASQAGIDFAGLMSQINSTAASFDSVYAGAVDKVLNTTMNLDQATLGFAESQTRLSESISNNGRELDIHTIKGEANREAILGVVQANQQEFDSMIAAGASADTARGAYEANTRALEDQMRKAHFTQEQIDGLIGKYRSVPADVNTAIQLHGLADAINGLGDIIRQVNRIPTTHDIYVTQHLSTVGGFSYKSPDRVDAYGKATGGITGAAGGGPRGNWTMVGEQGRELVKLPPGSQVMPHGQTESAVAGGGGQGAATVELYWKRTGDKLMDVILEQIGARIRTDRATADMFGVSA